MPDRFPINQEAIAAFCRRHGVRKLSLFGSVLRDDFDPEQSDIDVLIDLPADSEQSLSYFGLARMRFELEAIFGRTVDLSLVDGLDPYIRNRVLATAEAQYVAA